MKWTLAVVMLMTLCSCAGSPRQEAAGGTSAVHPFPESLRRARMAAERFHRDHGRWPASFPELESAGVGFDARDFTRLQVRPREDGSAVIDYASVPEGKGQWVTVWEGTVTLARPSASGGEAPRGG